MFIAQFSLEWTIIITQTCHLKHRTVADQPTPAGGRGSSDGELKKAQCRDVGILQWYKRSRYM